MTDRFQTFRDAVDRVINTLPPGKSHELTETRMTTWHSQQMAAEEAGIYLGSLLQIAHTRLGGDVNYRTDGRSEVTPFGDGTGTIRWSVSIRIRRLP